MTREKEIKQAAYSQYCNSESICFTLMCDSFKQGAEWADNHPNINSLWHTSDEVPQCNKRLVIHCDEKLEWTPINNTVLYEDSDYPWKELVELYNILHWAYAKDLVPNFNEEL